jgi:hypothetical protein
VDVDGECVLVVLLLRESCGSLLDVDGDGSASCGNARGW